MLCKRTPLNRGGIPTCKMQIGMPAFLGWGHLRITRHTMYKAPGTGKVFSVNFHPLLLRLVSLCPISVFLPFPERSQRHLRTPLINYDIPIYCLFCGKDISYIVSLVSNQRCSKMQREEWKWRGGWYFGSSQRLEKGVLLEFSGREKALDMPEQSHVMRTGPAQMPAVPLRRDTCFMSFNWILIGTWRHRYYYPCCTYGETETQDQDEHLLGGSSRIQSPDQGSEAWPFSYSRVSRKFAITMLSFCFGF